MTAITALAQPVLATCTGESGSMHGAMLAASGTEARAKGPVAGLGPAPVSESLQPACGTQ